MKLDVRCKFILLLFISILSFSIKDNYYGSIFFSAVVLLSFAMGQRKLALRYSGIYIVVFLLIKISPILPKVVSSLILMLAVCIRMFMPILLYANVFQRTTKVSEMIYVMYSLRIPKGFTITFAVAMRFFPTAKEEMRYIADAMKLRGIEVNLQNVIKRPGLLIESKIVPLMMRSATIAEELSAASITRGIDSPEKRSAYFRAHLTWEDVMITIFFVLLFFMIFYQKNFKVV